MQHITSENAHHFGYKLLWNANGYEVWYQGECIEAAGTGKQAKGRAAAENLLLFRLNAVTVANRHYLTVLNSKG